MPHLFITHFAPLRRHIWLEDSTDSSNIAFLLLILYESELQCRTGDWRDPLNHDYITSVKKIIDIVVILACWLKHFSFLVQWVSSNTSVSMKYWKIQICYSYDIWLLLECIIFRVSEQWFCGFLFFFEVRFWGIIFAQIFHLFSWFFKILKSTILFPCQ